MIPATGYSNEDRNDSIHAAIESPQTGDEGNAVLWLSILLASGAALTGAAFYRVKKKSGR